jgi:hypothetical protein
MNGLRYVRSRTLIVVIVVVALVLGHALLFHLARRLVISHVTVPSGVVAGVVLLVVAKHLGLLAAVYRALGDFFGRKPTKRGKENEGRP